MWLLWLYNQTMAGDVTRLREAKQEKKTRDLQKKKEREKGTTHKLSNSKKTKPPQPLRLPAKTLPSARGSRSYPNPILVPP